MSFVSARNLTRIFDVSKPWLNRLIERRGKARLTAVSDVSFSIAAHSTYALVGESGSGKSTIGKMLVGLLRPTSGRIRIGEIEASTADATRPEIQMIFQDPFASLNPRWKVRDIIVEPVAVLGGDTEGLSAQLLSTVGMAPGDGDKYPHEFSGGQRQRICIARALASKPAFIVCDEPTSALDVSVQAQVLNLMRDLQDSLGLTYLFISHDLTVVRHMADRIGVLYLGRLVEEADPAALFAHPRHPYTQLLLAAAPRVDQFGATPASDQGEIPDPISPPTGCAFHPRCPVAQDICRRERPEWRDIGDGKVACHLA